MVLMVLNHCLWTLLDPAGLFLQFSIGSDRHLDMKYLIWDRLPLRFITVSWLFVNAVTLYHFVKTLKAVQRDLLVAIFLTVILKRVFGS